MTTIERLRVRNGLDDPLVTRLRLERLLAAVQVRVFSPSALVVIRHLPDPLPGAIDLRRDWLRPPLAWEQAFTAQIERYLHAAARPRVEAVTANAPAVWFADASEYLACLSLDWVRGELSTHWWWRTVMRSDAGAAVETAWINQPYVVPATLHMLAERGLHAIILTHFSPATLVTITQQVERAYGLIALADRPLPPLLGRSSVAVRRISTLVPEATGGSLSSEVSRLLVIGLLLARRPAEAHRLLSAWLDDVATESPTRADEPTAAEAITPPSPLTESAQLPINAATSADADTETLTPGQDQTPFTTAPISSVPAYTALLTGYGGVFFLLNVALALRLYGDFTEPEYLGLALSPWEWLAQVAARLLGPTWHADDLAGALAQLSAPEPAEGYAPPPREWHLPASWLAAFPERDPGQVLLTGERLQVRHPAGFLLADMPLSGDADQQAQALLFQYDLPHAPTRLSDQASPFAADPLTWAAWFDLFIPYLQARLVRAVDLPSEAYLALPARVFITATQVDVVFALADLPLAVRLAGLDRDLGWLPAAGRSLRFYFE